MNQLTEQLNAERWQRLQRQAEKARRSQKATRNRRK